MISVSSVPFGSFSVSQVFTLKDRTFWKKYVPLTWMSLPRKRMFGKSDFKDSLKRRFTAIMSLTLSTERLDCPLFSSWTIIFFVSFFSFFFLSIFTISSSFFGFYNNFILKFRCSYQSYLQSVTKILKLAPLVPSFNVGYKFTWSFLATTSWHSCFRLSTTLNQGGEGTLGIFEQV